MILRSVIFFNLKFYVKFGFLDFQSINFQFVDQKMVKILVLRVKMCQNVSKYWFSSQNFRVSR